MKFHTWLVLGSALRARRGQLLRDWLESYQLEMRSNMEFWAKEMREANDAAMEISAMVTMDAEIPQEVSR